MNISNAIHIFVLPNFYLGKSILMKHLIFLILTILVTSFSSAQVGINTTSPDTSAALDVQFQTGSPKGMLTPRMTTLQRTAIASPANGLLVFDTDLKSFYYNEGTSLAPVWVKINSGAGTRTNFKRIQTEADLIASSTLVGGNYQLNTNTFYEINGTITLTKSIDLNNAYVSGLDANEDILSFTGGTVFKGTTGGSIKNVTLKGAKAFEITGPGILSSSSLLVQNAIIFGMTTSVGSISGLGLYYGGVVQFIGNADGITYSNIGNCLLDNQAWLSSNNGTFEKFAGTFGLIEKGSGFSTVDGADIALDVSTAGLTVGTGTLEGTVFSGISSSVPGYIKGYTTGDIYTGYNFTNQWTVNSPGIPRESDGVATGNLYYDNSSVITINTTAQKLPVSTNSIRLFRTAEGTGVDSENRLVYKGEKRRAINVLGSISFTAIAGSRYTFSIYKNNSKVIGSDVVADVLQTNARQSVSIIGTVDVVKNEYIEIYVQKNTAGTEQFLVTSYNIIVN
ncbi:hypothetical protein FNJ88_01415 [Chryseobacterium sp. SNU WT5]|uniref:hypothetical protein n=1 Tax=Chryseobacterium sp. SNU WT5 TaxID=2594269 RepID=UPI00117E0AE3|nr:hypothetical protein [Chryseobacterium sp. SNU WT5]QDP84275.1 hypothetical protein FNJ88_01415 [Chryseobacterium sp. SNU WT5]